MDASEQKLGSRLLKAWKRIVIVLAVAASILAAVFLASRYGWKRLASEPVRAQELTTTFYDTEDWAQPYAPSLGEKDWCKTGE